MTRISRFRRTNLIAGSVLWLIVFAGLALIYSRSRPGDKKDSLPEGSVKISEIEQKRSPAPIVVETERQSPTHLPEFRLTDADGTEFDSRDLLGRPCVVAFIFTHCAATCPAITSRMAAFQEQFSADELTLVSITVDPTRDTPERLKEFAANYGADRKRWKFLTGTPTEVHEVIATGFGMYYEELFGSKRLPGFEVSHTNRVVLVDSTGRFEDTFLATSDEEMSRMRRRIRRLDKGKDKNTDVEETPPGADDEETSGTGPISESAIGSKFVKSASSSAFFSVMDDPDNEQTGPLIDVSPGGDLRIRSEGPQAGSSFIYEHQLPRFEFQNQDGNAFGLDQLLGTPFVAGFVFTRCSGPCPRVSSSMAKLQDRLERMQAIEAIPWPIPGAGGFAELATSSIDIVDAVGQGRFPSFDGRRVQLLTISVDPENDSSEVLSDYAQDLSADPDRWNFLTGPRSGIYALIKRGFGQWVQETPATDIDPEGSILHTNKLVAVDAFGRIQGSFNALNDAEMIKLGRMMRSGEPLEALAVTSESSGLVNSPVTDAAELEEDPLAALPAWAAALPAVNASLNGFATVLLLTGFRLIRQGKREAHRNVMLLAFSVSIAFLGCYLVYHAALHHFTGESGRKFTGEGPIRIVYFSILISHVVLAVAVPVLAIKAIYHGLKTDLDRHRRVARIAFPVWLYVSMTGVIIYLMLYHWP